MSTAHKMICLVMMLFFSVSHLQAADGVNSGTREKYRQLKVSLEQMFKAKEGIYARDVLEGAQRTLARAQESIESKKEKAANQALEMVTLQIEQAKARTEEKDAAEKTAVTRAKVDKLEQKLANLLSGKGEEK
jgi:hypothetical protein